MAFFIPLIIALALMVVSYLLMPKPKSEPAHFDQMDDPTAEAGKPIPVAFGTIRVKSMNILDYKDKHYRVRTIDT